MSGKRPVRECARLPRRDTRTARWYEGAANPERCLHRPWSTAEHPIRLVTPVLAARSREVRPDRKAGVPEHAWCPEDPGAASTGIHQDEVKISSIR
ncbi:hypothetical protein AWI43_33845 [Streptomyces sp. WAC04657]|nr:hypothetical protein AWI43_33845 [Streptomyces sp. WAC04657]